MQEFEYIVVSAHLAGYQPINLGVVLVDAVRDELHLRFRTALPEQIEPEDAEVIAGFPQYCQSLATELGAAALLGHLLDSASNAIRVTDRLRVSASSASEALAIVYPAYVV
jgi:hypothetical protein